MSRSLNKVMLIGNLGQDPEIRTIPSGARVAQFSLATTRKWTGKDGQPQERTEWHRVVVWDSLPGTFAFVEKFVGKGDRIYVEGQIEYRSYEDKDGVMRYSTEIRASELLAAGELSGGEGGRRGGGAQSRTRSRATAGAGAGAGGGDYDDFQAPGPEDDDDLPF